MKFICATGKLRVHWCCDVCDHVNVILDDSHEEDFQSCEKCYTLHIITEIEN